MEGKGSHQQLWNEVKMLDKKEHWRVRLLKESERMLDYEDLHNKPSLEINKIYDQLIKDDK